MTRIHELLEQMGASKELAGKILESFETHSTDLKTKLDEEYKVKLKKAKAVCIEEVNQYKVSLSKKVQTYFEAKANKIEQQMTKQVAIRESNAESKLKQVYALLEGIKIDERGQADLQVLRDQVKKLQVVSRKLTEERNLASQKANRLSTIAEKAIKRSKTLESTIVENRAKLPARGQQTLKPKGAQPQTTQVTQASQVERTKPAPTTPVRVMAGYDPNTIAHNMGE